MDRVEAILGAMERGMAATGVNQSQLARALGITPSAVNQWFANRTLPATETLIQIPDALGMTWTELMGEGAEEEVRQAIRARAIRALEEVEGRIQDMKDRLVAEPEKRGAATRKAPGGARHVRSTGGPVSASDVRKTAERLAKREKRRRASGEEGESG